MPLAAVAALVREAVAAAGNAAHFQELASVRLCSGYFTVAARPREEMGRCLRARSCGPSSRRARVGWTKKF